MPAVYFDADVSGSGSSAFPDSSVIFVSADIVTLPLTARAQVDADEWLRAGWWALGDQFNIGLGTFDYWMDKHFIDFDHNVWNPDPTQDRGNSLNFEKVATRIRWQIGLGGVVHLHVLGF